MRYFLDTEFYENGYTIDLISIGIVAEDGRELYLESGECDLQAVSAWVLENVVPHLKEDWTSRDDIAYNILKFIGDDPKPEFWGYYADYDWVALCQLYGTMMDLPKGWPMFCMDLKQLCVMAGDPKLPEQGKGEHHALADARWNKTAFEFLVRFCEEKNQRMQALS